ncbi:hypothetical protein KOI35_09445 [Actinoplanes bogorensis]|uniref:Uncharacterized protein n=1 Tax=Paractinoplanes bogorensis TaxID=1610840 RepID=A0ABS5YJS4_9ACTN|nr:hypothetical protein [Actinoplanes bogorensis]MBU2663731.1 hypothetical protein [Actinoplanes bogorensis]
MRFCRTVRGAAIAVIAALTAGCGDEAPAPAWVAGSPSVRPAPSLLPAPSSPGVRSLGEPWSFWRSSTQPAPSSAPAPAQVSAGWEITVYYTAVERFHDGDPEQVTGCLKLDCKNGGDDLGTYPGDFVQAVHDEGTGHTTAGKYLNWSYDIGYWLDTEPRSADGKALTPFVSSAADPDVLAYGSRFVISSCGRQEDGSSPPAATCAALRRASWRITDEFTPGLGGSRHIDAYIGPETGPNFTGSDWYVTFTGARLTLG